MFGSLPNLKILTSQRYYVVIMDMIAIVVKSRKLYLSSG